MRNPKRIPILLDALKAEWEKNPDQRFGQLLFNLGYFARSNVMGTVADPFNEEDDRLALALGVNINPQDPNQRTERWTDDFGHTYRVHSKGACAGEFCVIHNESEHSMRALPKFLRNDRRGLIERICRHGVGHPDRDSVAFFDSVGVEGMDIHGCDGCG